jgi:hypothetical protein
MSELSALFAIYQVHAAMRVSLIVSRIFYWASTYEAAEINFKTTPPVSLKAVTQTHFHILLDRNVVVLVFNIRVVLLRSTIENQSRKLFLSRDFDSWKQPCRRSLFATRRQIHDEKEAMRINR